MNSNSPLLICISRTRNYGWITKAFLVGNTQWADYIVITDQMSTDGTREMCAQFNNVYLVDDNDMSFKEYSGFRMAFYKGRELANGRDAIYFSLDIDEILPANWMQTDDGQKILNSKPADMFSIAWANIQYDNQTYQDQRLLWDGKYTVFHDNGIDWQDCALELHAPHLPYSSWEIPPYAVKDFPILHFGWYNPIFNKYKAIYYQFLDVHQGRSKSPISLLRTYMPQVKKKSGNTEAKGNLYKPIEKEWLFKDFDLFALIDMSAQPVFIAYTKELIQQDGVKRYSCLDIWNDKDILETLGVVHDPRPLYWRMIHKYMHLTQPHKNRLPVKAIDKILKSIFKNKR